jgi:alkylated DNA repair dioxygenase AlkB
VTTAQDDLFGAAPLALDLPEGMRYQEEFLSREEEAQLIAQIEQLPLAAMKYQQYEARRRVVNYGGKYDFSAQKLEAAPPVPEWLAPLRKRAAAWAGIPPGELSQALVAEYTPGTPLGWHRDVPDHEDIIGVSLLNEAMLKFRPYPHVVGKKSDVRKVLVAPRSIYLLRGAARWAWQHSVPAVKLLRYSITLRTPRRR